ncbi:MAG: Bug family tripartite tricarboxylate transporter substrate binding protein [Polaromonas sp.]
MHPSILKLLAPVVLAVAAWQLPLSAAAQAAWPDRPVKLVVPYPPGGTSDNLGRLVAERLSAHLGTPVIVDNKPGGTTQVGTEIVARAAPDGNTLLLGAVTAFTVLPHLRNKLPYDAKNGFEPLGGIAEYLAVLTVRKDLGVSTLAELVQLAKAHPGKLTYGSAGLASFGHIAGELVKRETGISMLHVPFKGSADAANALAGGQIDVLIDGATVALAKAGRVTPLAAFGSKRHPELPNVPSLPETGIRVRTQSAPGWGLFTPKGTPAAINVRLSQALEKMLAEPDTQARLQRISTLPDWRTPSDLRMAIAADYKYYAELLPAIGIRPED